MIRIPLTKEDHVWADLKAKEDIDNAARKGMISRFNTNEEFNKYIGNLGEIAFKHYLNKNNIDHDWQNVTGQADDYDFKINNKLWDVKTIQRNRHFRISWWINSGSNDLLTSSIIFFEELIKRLIIRFVGKIAFIS